MNIDRNPYSRILRPQEADFRQNAGWEDHCPLRKPGRHCCGRKEQDPEQGEYPCRPTETDPRWKAAAGRDEGG